MQKLAVAFIVYFLTLSTSYTQILDDDAIINNNATVAESTEVTETNEDDILFDEMFSEYTDEEKDVTLEKSFNDIISQSSETFKNNDKLKNKKEDFTPLTGDLLVGVTKGSFKTFSDIGGRIACSFGVTLKSNVDKDIKTIGIQLLFSNRTFAFIFKNIAAGKTVEHFITTRGDICYNMAEIPNIEVNICKIVRTSNGECAKKLKYDSSLESPDPQKNPYK